MEPRRSDMEIGFQRLLAYLSETRPRKWIAYVSAFLILYTTIHYLYSLVFAFFLLILNLTSYPVHNLFSNLIIFSLVTTAISIILPLILTMLVFLWLNRIVRSD